LLVHGLDDFLAIFGHSLNGVSKLMIPSKKKQ
jgi:hypothetical protein